MRSGVIAQKVGMTRVFNDAGEHVPVTVLKLDELPGASRSAPKRRTATRPCSSAPARKAKTRHPGRCAATSPRPRSSRRASWPSSASAEDNLIEVGAEITADHFVAGPVRRRHRHHHRQGLPGAMKRWNFGGLRATHGVSVSHRSHGSTGQRQDPGQGLQGQEDGRPHGPRARDHAEPRGRRDRRRAGPCSGAWRRSGHQGRLDDASRDAVKRPLPKEAP